MGTFRKSDEWLGDVYDTTAALDLAALAYDEGRIDEARGRTRAIKAHIAETTDLARRPFMWARLRKVVEADPLSQEFLQKA